MEELRKCDKLTLKSMAISRGLNSKGFNGKCLSKMGKKDFIDFIASCDDNNNTFEDEIIGHIIEQLINDDTYTIILPFFNSVSERIEKEYKERIPNDVDEIVPQEINIETLESKVTCVVCQTNFRNIVILPCNHLATCITCCKNPLLTKCPICRKEITDTIRIFVS
jgi:hypothetical protein